MPVKKQGNQKAVIETEKYDLTSLFSNDVEKKNFFDQLKITTSSMNMHNDFYFKDTQEAIEQ